MFVGVKSGRVALAETFAPSSSSAWTLKTINPAAFSRRGCGVMVARETVTLSDLVRIQVVTPKIFENSA